MPPALASPEHMLTSLFREGDMSRRRLQKEGHLFKDGKWWRLRWREDAVDANGKLVRTRPSAIIGLAVGPQKLTQKQAERQSWDQILSKLDAFTRVPNSLMTLAQFVTQKFEPEHIWTLKHAGKEHYKYCLSKILPTLGSMRLRDIRGEKIQELVRGLVDSGKSIQTASHVRTAIHAVFEHAKQVGYFTGDNPASMVRLPQMVRRNIQSLSFDQASHALALLPSPVKEMVYLSMTTSPNVAELCGLRWRRLNLSDDFITCDGETITPRSMMIRENWYRNRPGTVKTGKRNRIVPLPKEAIRMLEALKATTKFGNPDHYVFASRTGNPVDAHNTNNRIFGALSKVIGAKVTWHIFRHSCATFAEQVGMDRSDRIALMGHGTGSMTDHYTHSDTERRRAGVERIAEGLANAAEKKHNDSGPDLARTEVEVQCIQ